MPADENADLALVLADPRQLAVLQPDQVPRLLGALEQLRASLWARLLHAPGPPARDPGVDASDEVLTVVQVAGELKFTRSYVYEAIRRGDLAAVRKGKYVRVRRSDLRAWLAGHSARGLDARPVSPDSPLHASTLPGPTSPPRRLARRAGRLASSRSDAAAP